MTVNAGQFPNIRKGDLRLYIGFFYRYLEYHEKACEQGRFLNENGNISGTLYFGVKFEISSI